MGLSTLAIRLLCGVLCFFSTVKNASSQVTCPAEVNDEIQRCVTPVAQFAETLGVDVKESALGADRLMPSMGSEVFRQLCSKITTFSTCVRKAKRQCPNHITLTLINASYGYLCTDGYDVFVKNADCLMRLDQEESVRLCHDRTMSTIKNSSVDTKATMAQKLTRMCHSLNYFATCVEQPVLRECGSAAWSVIARVLHDTTKTLMPTCNFAIPVSEQGTSADAVIGAKSGQQQSNTSKTSGRAKAVGTMAAKPDTKGGKKAKNNSGMVSSLYGDPVGGASMEKIVWKNLLLAVMSSVSLWWLEGRWEVRIFQL